ncbi:MAG: hypothetical protein EOM59_06765 [Clostridia bacterium]|nr:hypothetical protein [Clostridia bacterium]
MKNLTIAMLILFLGLSMIGCSKEKAEVATLGVLDAEGSEIELEEVVKSIEAPQEAQAMFSSCAQLVSYLAVSTYNIDMQSLSAEDFWLILSLVTYAQKPDSVGEFGTIDMEYETVYDIAETFFSEMLLSSEMPAPKGIYSATYVPAEQLYELQPVSISDVSSELVGLEQTDKSGSRFLMRIKLIDVQDRIQEGEWHVTIEAWEDGKEHFFPYKFVKAWHVE